VIRTLIADRLLRTTWGFPLVVATAIAGAVGIELLHRDTYALMGDSVHANEVHHQANVANYYALDRVNSLRSYLLHPNPLWIERYRRASAEIANSLGVVQTFLRRSGPAGEAQAEQVAQAFANRTVALDEAFEHAKAGRSDDALAALRASDASGAGIALRESLLDAIKRSEAERGAVRERLAAVLNWLRWVVHGLFLLMLLGAYALMRQTQLMDATHRRQAEWLENQVAVRTAELRELAANLITTREDERNRLARELHDEMGGLLSSIKLDLARLKRASAGVSDKALELAGAVDRRLTEVVDLKRRVIESLRPSALDHLGLTRALSVLCQENAATMQVPTHESLDLAVNLDPDLDLTLYRMVQEALTNARKYSRARQIWVSLKGEGDTVRATVEDDGVGFEPGAVGPGHHGLTGMRLRVESHGGRLEIQPRPGGGMRISAVVPALRRNAEPVPA
jgi:signal transduction histidine kinase